MSKSLQEQLRALGLAKSEPRPKADRKPVEKRRETPQPKARHSKPEPSLEEAYRIRDQQSKLQDEQAREAKRLEDLQRRKTNNEIRAIIDAHRLNDPAAELARNFIYKGRIRKIHVTADQLAELNAGNLGVVYLSGGYHLLATSFVDHVRALSVDHVPELTASAPDDQDGDHPVPDDLIW